MTIEGKTPLTPEQLTQLFAKELERLGKNEEILIEEIVDLRKRVKALESQVQPGSLTFIIEGQQKSIVGNEPITYLKNVETLRPYRSAETRT